MVTSPLVLGDAQRYAVMNRPLPKQLRYMEPFIRYLDSLPRDDLNEDVDSTLLEKALRKRLSCDDPEARFASDRTVLENWLDSFDSNTHSGRWIQGFMFGLTAAEVFELENTDAPSPAAIAIEPPVGWSASSQNSELRKGGSHVILIPMDEFGFSVLKQQLDQPLSLPPSFVATRSSTDVEYNESKGRKYVYHQTSPADSMQIDYLLSVRGGCILIRVAAMDRGFVDSELEASFGTLSIQSSMA